MRHLAIIPDSHHPFQDKRACAITLQAVEYFFRGRRDNVLITLGDQLDFYSVSAHSKDPNRVHLLEGELESGHQWLTALESCGKAAKYFIKGNHEYRLERYLADRAPALFNTCRLEKLLALKSHGWECIPYKKGLTLGKVYYTHDLGQAGPHAGSRARQRYGGNVVIGHTHYANATYQSNGKGDTHVGISAGWLGDAESIDYVSSVNAHEWTHSFLLGYLEPDGTTHFTLIPIVKGRACVEGKTFK
jgi:predicted phosphodiesterase